MTFVRQLNCLDCILISIYLGKLYENPNENKVVVCGFEKVIIDLRDMRVYFWDENDVHGFQ